MKTTMNGREVDGHELAVRVTIKKLMAGDMRAIEFHWNRMEGMPPQTIVNHNEGRGLNVHLIQGAVDESKLEIEKREEPTGDAKEDRETEPSQ